jgi:hypothetical protein
VQGIVLALVLVASLAACTSDDPLPPLSLTGPPAELVAGETIDVSGEGRPAGRPDPDAAGVPRHAAGRGNHGGAHLHRRLIGRARVR